MCAASERASELTAAFQQLPCRRHIIPSTVMAVNEVAIRGSTVEKFGHSLSSWQYHVLDHKLMLFSIVYLYVSATSDVPNCTITEILLTVTRTLPSRTVRPSVRIE